MFTRRCCRPDRVGYNTEAVHRELHRVLNLILVAAAAAAITALVLANTVL